METQTMLHPLAGDYLRRLRVAARRLPRARARELIGEIEEHLRDAVGPQASDAEVLTVLERLGEPDEIVAAEDPGGAANAGARGVQEWAAVILLPFGGFVFGVGWLVGLILLWSSGAWKTWEKWLGTLVVPGGLAGTFFFLLAGASMEGCVSGPGRSTQCTGGPSAPVAVLQIALFVFAVAGPLLTAVFLARRAATPSALR